MAFWQVFYSVGLFIAYWINYIAAKHRDSPGDWDWKIVVIFQLLLPVLITIQLPWVPESPRWLIHRRNDVDAARKALFRMRSDSVEVEAEILAIRQAIEYEKEGVSTGAKWYLQMIKDPSIRTRLLLGFAINIGQQLGGQGTLNSYSSTIYKKVFQSVDSINLINALNSTCGTYLPSMLSGR